MGGRLAAVGHREEPTDVEAELSQEEAREVGDQEPVGGDEPETNGEPQDQDRGEGDKEETLEEIVDSSSELPNLELEDAHQIGGEKKSIYERSSFARGIMDCGTCFTKYILCLFNFIILVAGAGVLFLGVWIYADKDSLFSFAKSLDESAIPELEKFSQPEITTNISYILMAVGGSMFILSILGYCGALRESRCLLGFYGSLLVLILILEITAGGLAFFYKDRAEDEVRAILKGSITNNYSTDPTADNTPSMFANLIMTKLHCCGVDNYTDFQASPSFVETGLQVPPACCVFKDNNGTLIDPDCPKKPNKQNSYYMTGCYQTIMNQIKEHMNIVIYVIVVLVLIELLSTFFAFCLCKSIEPYDK